MKAIWVVDVDIILNHRIIELKGMGVNLEERLEEIFWLLNELHKHVKEMKEEDV